MQESQARTFVWSDELIIGHQRIDGDHRELIGISGEIEDLIAGNCNGEALGRKLDAFYKLLVAHCAFEEDLMQALPRPLFGHHVDRHSLQHAVLIQRAKSLIEAVHAASDLEQSGLEFSKLVVSLMKDLIEDDFKLIGALVGKEKASQGSAAPSAAPPPGKGKPLTVGMYLSMIVASALVLLLIMLGYTVYETTARVQGEIRNSARAFTAGIAAEIKGIFDTNRQAMENIAMRPLIRAPDQKTCDPILWDFKAIFPRFANITTIEPDGTALCSAVPQPGGKPVNVFKAEWFQRVIAEKNFVVGKPFMGPITGRWVSVLTLPVYNDQSQVVRYLGFPLDLVAFSPSIATPKLFHDAVVGVGTPDGVIVWRNKDADAWVGKSLRNRKAFSNFIENSISETTVTGIDDVERTYFFDRISDVGWVVWIGVPTGTVHSLWLRVLPLASFLGMLGLLLVGAIAYLAARRIAKPMRDLSETARKIRSGDSQIRASMAGPQEVAEVAQEFNALIDLRDRQTEELLRSNTELERFAYVASHDLQEPVRTVVAYSQLLGRRNAEHFDADSKEYLEFIIGGARRMSDLVRDLLSYSKVSGLGTRFSTLDMNEVVQDALFNLQALIVQSGAIVKVQDAPLPAVQGDRLQLLEVFQNLITNAIRFGKPGTQPVIGIKASADSQHAVFTVCDSGIGIEEQYWDQIFIIFKRLHGTAFPGTGIGLAICKKIIEGHGGRIWVESKPGEGSCFSFALPLN